MHFKGIIDGRVWMQFEKNVNSKYFPGSYKKKSVHINKDCHSPIFRSRPSLHIIIIITTINLRYINLSL